jgi:hypothetical protein
MIQMVRLIASFAKEDERSIRWTRRGLATFAAFGMLAGLLATALPAQAAVPSGWGTAAPIGTDVGYSYSSRVAASADGTAIAVWMQANSIWASHYSPASGWQGSTLVETDDSGFAQDPAVGMDARGNAIAVWEQRVDFVYNIWFARYHPRTGWDVPAILSTSNTHFANDAHVAVEPGGDAMAVWEQQPFNDDQIWACRFTVSGGWETPLRIDSVNISSGVPFVAIDDAGNAVATWSQNDVGSAVSYMWANEYSPKSGWGTPQHIEDLTNGDGYGPGLASTPNGVVFSVFQVAGDIWSNRYDPGNGWGRATLVETNAQYALEPDVAVDAEGTAHAVWAQASGARYDIWSNTYTSEAGWGSPRVIETDNTGDARAPHIAIDPFGGAVATWEQATGSWLDIWANRFVPASGWGTASLVETDNQGQSSYPWVATDGGGNAFVVWNETVDGQSRTWANRFAAPDTTLPAISISSPADGSSTNVSTALIVGATEPGARVSVNGVEATVRPDGSFSVPLALRPGVNPIVVTASDLSGNMATTMISVTFLDRLPELEQQLATAQAQLDAASANLSSAQTRVAALESDANASAAALSAAQADLSAANARMAALDLNFNAVRGELNATRALQAAAQNNISALQGALGQATGDAATANAHAASAEATASSNAGAASTATLLGLLGIIAGVGGMVMGLRAARSPRETAAPPVPGVPAPAPSPPPDRPQ